MSGDTYGQDFFLKALGVEVGDYDNQEHYGDECIGRELILTCMEMAQFTGIQFGVFTVM